MEQEIAEKYPIHLFIVKNEEEIPDEIDA